MWASAPTFASGMRPVQRAEVVKSFFLNFHQRIQQVLQVVLAVEFQLEASLALAVDDLHAPAQVLAQALFALLDIIHLEDGCFLCRLLLPGHILAQQLRLTDGETEIRNFLGGLQLLFAGFQH